MASVTLGPAVLDLAGIRAGDRNAIRVTLTRDGNPYDLTGQTVTAQARKTALDETSVVSAEVDMVDQVGGVFMLRWPGEDVRTLLAGKGTWSGVWDMQVSDGTNDPLTVAAGSFQAVYDVTRP